MVNKKTLKRNKKQRGKSKKGGILNLFKDKHNKTNTECDPNNLVNLTDSTSMHANYQTCCPKTWYGRKNNSPYCKQLDLNYKAAFQSRQNEANFNKEAITSTFTSDGDNGIMVDTIINCKTPNLYNTKEEIQKYIESCKCNNLNWYNYNGKNNCKTVKEKLDRENKRDRKKEILNEQNKKAMNVFGYTNEEWNTNKAAVQQKIKKKQDFVIKFIKNFDPTEYNYDDKKQIWENTDELIMKLFPPEKYNYSEDDLKNKDIDVIDKILDVDTADDPVDLVDYDIVNCKEKIQEDFEEDMDNKFKEGDLDYDEYMKYKATNEPDYTECYQPKTVGGFKQIRKTMKKRKSKTIKKRKSKKVRKGK